MKTLLTLFSEGRNELQAEIDKAIDLEQVIKLVHNQLDNLERIYVGQLSLAQVRLVNFFLETLRQSVATLTAANATKSDPVGQITNQTMQSSPSRLILKLLQGGICIGILGESFSLSRTAPGAWMAILLTSVLVGLEVILQLDRDNQSGSPQLGYAPQLSVQVDSKVLLDNLADALNTIDQAITSAEVAKRPLGSSGIEELPELLNFLQRLMGASFLEKPVMTFELAKLLPQIFMEQGIQAQIYRADDEHSREYFDFEPSIDRSAKDYVTVTPALLKGDRLLRRGRVIEPAYSGARG